MRLLQRDPYLATRIRLKILSLMVMLSMALCQVTTGAEATRTGLWNLLKQAIDAGGADAADVYQLLGSIDDKTARQLLETSFAEKNGFAISSSARGLSVHQCQYYLPRLNAAALDPAVGPQPAILSAIARAGSADAAQVLMNIADKAPPSVAGVAFGLLENMGAGAESFLEKEAVGGRSPAGRETAIAILRRGRTRNAAATFKAALRDQERSVRLAAAIGLAELGINDGAKQLRIAVADKKSPYYLDGLASLAALQDPDAIRSLKALLTGSGNVVKAQAVWAVARSGSARLKALAYEWGAVNTPTSRAMFAEKMLNPRDPVDRSRLYAMLPETHEMSSVVAADKLYKAGFDNGAVAAIRRELNSGNEEVRHYAIRTASNIPALWPVLAARLSETGVVMKSAALHAIRKLHQTAKFYDVEKEFTGKDRDLSWLAAKVLAGLDLKMAHSLFQDQLESEVSYVRLYSAAILLTGMTPRDWAYYRGSVNPQEPRGRRSVGVRPASPASSGNKQSRVGV